MAKVFEVEPALAVEVKTPIAELCDRAERLLDQTALTQAPARHITACKSALRNLVEAVRELDAQVKSLVERSKP